MFEIFKRLFAPKDNQDLIEALQQGAFLVDVRTPIEFSFGSVSGATNIPLDKLLNSLPMFKNKKKIVVFCRSGSRSSKAKKMLEDNGFQGVINGGSWQNVNQIIK